ncbi:hypothetical protein TNCV_4623021 [Trichonephila clavipes]|nr:hypothetical protein TNCV_4623021 [Trichonephila clavipes]
MRAYDFRIQELYQLRPEWNPQPWANEAGKLLLSHRSRQILGSDQYFHFVHKTMPRVRNKRSIPHTKDLKKDPLDLRFESFSGSMADNRKEIDIS